MLEPSYHYLISCGVHVGHSLANSHRLCGWMVLAQRQKVLLIDLSKFIHMFSRGLSLLQHAVRFRHPFWFITLDAMKASIVRKVSKLCGEYSVTSCWIGGLLTNFLSLSRHSWIRYMYLSPLVHSAKQRLRRELYEDWLLTRLTWPRLVFLCGVRHSYRVAREASLAGIVCLGIADTATGAHALSLAIPGNDESLEAIYFYNTLLANAVLLKKFTTVFAWASSVRKTSRLGNFVHWFAFHGLSRLKRWTKGHKTSSTWSSYSPRGSTQPAFSTTASLMSKLMLSALAVSRHLPKAQEVFSLDTPAATVPLSDKRVRLFFVHNDPLFQGLLALRFLASRRNLLKRWVAPSFRALKRRRPIGYSHRKSTFTFRHNYLDLLAPTPLGLERDYVYKRGVTIAPFFSYRNPSLERVAFKLLSALFLLYARYQRFPLQSPQGGVTSYSYEWRSPYRRRLRRENAPAAAFFQRVLYIFLARALNLTFSVARGYRLPGKEPIASRFRKASLVVRKGAASDLRLLAVSRMRFARRRKASSSRRWKAHGSPWYLLRSLRKHRRKLLRRARRPFFLQQASVGDKAFSFFQYHTWQFEQGFLPRLYWQSRLLHVPSQSSLPLKLVGKMEQRSFSLRRLASYPLLLHSIHWARAHKQS